MCDLNKILTFKNLITKIDASTATYLINKIMSFYYKFISSIFILADIPLLIYIYFFLFIREPYFDSLWPRV